MIKEDGEIINMNKYSVEKIMGIKEDNQNKNLENEINEMLNNSDNNPNDINQPLINNS